ncbi:hypothetical protein CRG98_009935 [Punica granatum]|uniref:Uncharacterized protein n=1 Tax=Punica granatum TaxID=22663 RepID=A0A2I0KMF7_PUNGR|nr:hypothetical protein CRG98_009935 [Punica granatum]
MDRSTPDFRLESLTPLGREITRIWRAFPPIARAYIRLIIGDLSMLAESPIDWTFLRTTIESRDPQRTVFNFQGTELTPTVEEYTALIQRPMPTWNIIVPNQFAVIQSQLSILLGIRIKQIYIHALRAAGESYYQGNACHEFLLQIFGTLLFPHASNLIDGALA